MSQQHSLEEDVQQIVTQHFISAVCGSIDTASKITIFREMEPHVQFGCFLTGALTAVFIVAFKDETPAKRKKLAEFIVKSMDAARQNAETLLEVRSR